MSELAIPLGLRWPDGALLAEGVALAELAIRASGEAEVLTDQPTATLPGWSFDVLGPAAPRDFGDPKSVGWGVVVATADPDADATLATLAPLLAHRGAKDESILRYPGGDENDRADWIETAYLGLGDKRPRYLLLAGDPVQLPFELQATLASAGAAVGRVAFDEPAHLATYVAKVIAHEEVDAPYSTQSAIVWATDYGPNDATHYSAAYLAEPIAGAVDESADFTVTRYFRDEATKKALLDSMSARPGLVFTASHGMAASTDDGLAVQQRVNGAWCCARTPGMKDDEWLLEAADLPADSPVWEGSVVVQFACWGYGTPAESTFKQWTGQTTEVTAEQPFIAAIPKRLLANPHGPIGYVGHVDTAWLQGFDDPAHPIPEGLYSPRLEPMLTLVSRDLLDRSASGYGMGDLADKAATIASEVSNLMNRLRGMGKTIADLDSNARRKLADRMIRRNDAMWFLFFGDPGVRIRVGT
jgi:hypothetical protein